MLLLAGACIGLNAYVESDSFRQLLSRRLSNALQRDTTFERNLEFSFAAPPRLRLHGLRIANPAWAQKPYFARVDQITLAPRLLPLLGGNLALQILQASGGQIWIESNPKGETSWPHRDQSNQDAHTEPGFPLNSVGTANIDNFVITTAGVHQFQLQLDKVRAGQDGGLTRQQMHATGTFDKKPFTASWLAPETLWFLQRADEQKIDIKLQVGESDVDASLNINSANPRPHISGQLHSRKIVASGGKRDENNRLIPDWPLPIRWLDWVDADLDWKIDRLRLGPIILRDLRSQTKLSDGQLHIDPLDARIGKAPLHLRALYAAVDERASVRVSGEVDNLDLSEKIDWLTTKKSGNGFVNLRFVANGVGRTAEQVAAALNGNLQLVMQEGQVSNAWLQRVTSDLGSLINPWSDVDGQTPVRCLAARLVADRGLVNVDQLVLDTRAALILGEGSINLRKQTVDITLSPDARSLSLLKLQLPIHISGPLTAPDADPDPTGIITRPGASILQQLATAGGLLDNERVTSRFAGSSKGCQASLKAYRDPDEDSAEDDKPDNASGKTAAPSP